MTSHRVGSHKHRHVRVLCRPIAVPSATVGRELSEKPVFRHLAEMVVVNQRVLFDPEGEYYNQGGRGRLDDNHFPARCPVPLPPTYGARRLCRPGAGEG